MSNLNGLMSQIKQAAQVVATATESTIVPGMLFDADLRETVAENLAKAKNLVASKYLASLRQQLTQPDVQSIQLTRSFKADIPNLNAEHSTSLIEAAEHIIEYLEIKAHEFYKAFQQYEEAEGNFLAAEAQMESLRDAYHSQSDNKAALKELEQEHEKLEDSQQANMKQAEAAAAPLQDLARNLGIALQQGNVLFSTNTLYPQLSNSQLASVFGLSRNINQLNSSLAFDLSRAARTKEALRNLKKTSAVKSGLSSKE
jgi:hypothetical protein